MRFNWAFLLPFLSMHSLSYGQDTTVKLISSTKTVYCPFTTSPVQLAYSTVTKPTITSYDCPAGPSFPAAVTSPLQPPALDPAPSQAPAGGFSAGQPNSQEASGGSAIPSNLAAPPSQKTASSGFAAPSSQTIAPSDPNSNVYPTNPAPPGTAPSAVSTADASYYRPGVLSLSLVAAMILLGQT